MKKSDITFAVCASCQLVSIVGLCLGKVNLSIYLMLAAIYLQLVKMNTKD